MSLVSVVCSLAEVSATLPDYSYFVWPVSQSDLENSKFKRPIPTKAFEP
jgi:hypothetical protein